MDLLFIVIYSAWFLSEILLNRFMRSKSTDRQDADKSSISFIWITIVGCVSLAVFIAMRYYFPVSRGIAVRYLGLALIITGILLRFYAIASLGKFFTVDVTIRKGHTLMKDGFYRYLRHPSYSASLLSFIGLGFSLNNWISLLLITIPVLAVFIMRIRIEEKVLIGQFGEEYLDYKRTTSGIIPFVF